MPKRRHFLHLLATSIGGTLIYTLNRQPQLQAQDKSPTATLRIPLRFFTEPEALTIAAAAGRIFPATIPDPAPPKQTSSSTSIANLPPPTVATVTASPSPPSRKEPRNRATRAAPLRATPTAKASPPSALPSTPSPPQQQDHRLRDIESTRFFRLLRQHVVEGMFADPMHGGNASLIGWQLIGFPGPYMSWSADMGKHDGRRFRPKPKSLAQIIGRPVTPWEDE